MIPQDLFVAGTDTSASTMQWALAELINHPIIFKKVREEIDSVVGTSRLVEEKDISSLPYFQAVMKEILQLHPTVPLIPRMSREDCKIGGFDIPKNTTILISSYAAMRDPNLWNDPDEFKPERFLVANERDDELDQENPTIFEGKLPNLLNFGGGRRRCPGKMLAFATTNPTIAALVQCFDWIPIRDEKKAHTVNLEVKKDFNHVMDQSLVCIPRVRFNLLKQ